MTISIKTLSLAVSSAIMLSVAVFYCYAECVMLSVVMLSVVMLSFVMLSVIMLSVVMLSVVMLSFVAPLYEY